jgi:hypothetical protein
LWQALPVYGQCLWGGRDGSSGMLRGVLFFVSAAYIFPLMPINLSD